MSQLKEGDRVLGRIGETKGPLALRVEGEVTLVLLSGDVIVKVRRATSFWSGIIVFFVYGREVVFHPNELELIKRR